MFCKKKIKACRRELYISFDVFSYRPKDLGMKAKVVGRD